MRKFFRKWMGLFGSRPGGSGGFNPNFPNDFLLADDGVSFLFADDNASKLKQV